MSKTQIDDPLKCDNCGVTWKNYISGGQCYGLAKDCPFTAKLAETAMAPRVQVNNGSTASYYELPPGATELYHLIIHKNMNAQLGEMFRALYRYGDDHHSSRARDMRKVIRYAEMELERLAAYEGEM